MAVWPAFTVSDVELPGPAPKEKSSGAFIISVSATDVLPAKLASPPYTAVIECDPAVREVVAKMAMLEVFSVPVPNVVEPSLNVTMPVGVPVLPAILNTVAVNVTDCPRIAGLDEDVRAVEVGVKTVSVTAVEVLPAKLGSPEYLAVIECVPAAKEDVLIIAWAFAPKETVPI